jgi:hypothetical protein
MQGFKPEDVYPDDSSRPTKLDVGAKLLTPKWVVEVAKTPDADLRAHRVALSYHYYARDLDRCINGRQSVWFQMEEQHTPGAKDANWFNFGTWATATINRDLTIRQPPAGSDRFMPAGLRQAVTRLLLHVRAADGQRVSRALGWGQRLVFLSTTFIHLARRTEDSNKAGILVGDDDHLRGLKRDVFERIVEWSEWDETEYISRERHLEAIWSAFDHYAAAADAANRLASIDPPQDDGSPSVRTVIGQRRRLEAIRSRHILYANLLVTAVEQEIVNQAVGAVIDNTPTYLSHVATGRLAIWGERFLGVQRVLTGRSLPIDIAPLTISFREAWARFMTEQVLVMLLPCETLRLGRDLPPLHPGTPFFPPNLSDLSSLPGFALDGPGADPVDESILDDLRLLVTAFDRSRGDGQGTGARDWRSYSDRMNWATTLIRSRQQDLSLFWAPYSEDDEQRIIGGRLPHLPGDPSQYDVDAPFTYIGKPGSSEDPRPDGSSGLSSEGGADAVTAAPAEPALREPAPPAVGDGESKE